MINKILTFLLSITIRIVIAIPISYLIGYSCDQLFDTMMLDNFSVLYMAVLALWPALKLYHKYM